MCSVCVCVCVCGGGGGNTYCMCTYNVEIAWVLFLLQALCHNNIIVNWVSLVNWQGQSTHTISVKNFLGIDPIMYTFLYAGK